MQTADGALPLLAPMSEVAGRMAPQVGAHSLERAHGGRGVLLGGVSGVLRGQGRRHRRRGLGHERGRDRAGHAGARSPSSTATSTSCARADRIYQGHLQTVASNAYEVERAVLDADLVIGAVLVAGAKAPVLVSNELVRRMKPGSVLVDIAVDQGGCFEDTRPTTHDDPTFRVHDSVFYCVANMPGAVPNTSTHALTNVTLPYVMALANEGTAAAVAGRPGAGPRRQRRRRPGVLPEVAEAHGMPSVPLAGGLCLTASPPTSAPGPSRRAGRHRLPRPPHRRARPRGQHHRLLPPRPAALHRVPRRGRRAGPARGGRVRRRRRSWPRCAQGDDDHPPLSATSAARAVVAVRGLHRFALLDGLVPDDVAARGAAADAGRGGCPRRSRSSRWWR